MNLTNIQITTVFQTVIKEFAKALNALNRFSHVYVTTPSQGKSVTVPLITAGNEPIPREGKQFNDASIIGNPAEQTIEVSLDQDLVSGFALSPADVADKPPELIRNIVLEKSGLKINAMAAKVQRYLLSLVTESAFPNYLVADAASYDAAEIAKHAVALRDANFPIPGTIGMLGPDHYSAISADGTLGTQVQAGLIRFGDIGASFDTKDGLTLYQAFGLPAGLTGFYAAPDALALAMRPSLQFPDGYSIFGGAARTETLVDATTGAVLTAYVWPDLANARLVFNFMAEFGGAKGNPEALRRLVDAAPTP